MNSALPTHELWKDDNYTHQTPKTTSVKHTEAHAAKNAASLGQICFLSPLAYEARTAFSPRPLKINTRSLGIFPSTAGLLFGPPGGPRNAHQTPDTDCWANRGQNDKKEAAATMSAHGRRRFSLAAASLLLAMQKNAPLLCNRKTSPRVPRKLETDATEQQRVWPATVLVPRVTATQN